MNELPAARSLFGVEGPPSEVKPLFSPGGIEIVERPGGQKNIVITAAVRSGEFYAVWNVQNNASGLSQELVVRGCLRDKLYAAPAAVAALEQSQEGAAKSSISFYLESDAEIGEPKWSQFETSITGRIRDYVTVEHVGTNSFEIMTDFSNTTRETSRRRDIGEILFKWPTADRDLFVGVPVIVVFKNPKTDK